MGKRYFVLKKGYLNIDEDFFYFSDHGNWETCKILEETEVPRLTFFHVSNHVIRVTYSILATILGVSFLTGKFNLSYSILLLGIVFHIINLRYKIKYFKIPLHKIEKVVLHHQKFTIQFINSKDKSIEHVVKLDDKTETKDLQSYLHQYFSQKLNIA